MLISVHEQVDGCMLQYIDSTVMTINCNCASKAAARDTLRDAFACHNNLFEIRSFLKAL